VEGLAEVPVGGVDQAHGLRLIVCGRRGEPLAWDGRWVVASDVKACGRGWMWLSLIVLV